MHATDTRDDLWIVTYRATSDLSGKRIGLVEADDVTVARDVFLQHTTDTVGAIFDVRRLETIRTEGQIKRNKIYQITLPGDDSYRLVYVDAADEADALTIFASGYPGEGTVLGAVVIDVIKGKP